MKLWTSWPISGPGRSSLKFLRDGGFSLLVSECSSVNLKRRYSARVCATRTKHKHDTNQLCSIKQRALNTTNTFQQFFSMTVSYFLYSSYNSVIIVIIVIVGDDELMLL